MDSQAQQANEEEQSGPRLPRRSLLVGTVAAAGVAAAGVSQGAAAHDRFDVIVDPARGDDRNDGRTAAPGRHGHGPVRTLDRAQELAHAHTRGRVVRVGLRGGVHRRSAPFVVEPHPHDLRVEYAAFPGERPVISGAEQITGWRATRVHGRRAWQTTVPAVRDGDWYFRQLFVDGQRRPRSRMPKAAGEVIDGRVDVDDVSKYFYSFDDATVDGTTATTFVYRDDDIHADWHDRDDVDVVSIRQWFDERAPIADVDPAAHTCTIAFRPYPGKTWSGRYYYVDNVYEELGEPGEWYLDRRSGRLTYLPRPGERLGRTRVVAPHVRHLVQFSGTAETPVRGVTFAGVGFEHTSWDYWTQSWTTGQSGASTVGAVTFAYASRCGLRDCTVRSVGEYGVAVNEYCEEIRITGCQVTDTGCGGIKVASCTGKAGVATAGTGGNVITDNEIHNTGKVFHLGAGVFAADTYANTIAHNHIHDLFYTGVSVGLSWGFAANPARENTVHANHIHDIGKGLLSDLGGIYTLGVQPGSTVTGNYIHDIRGQMTGAPAAGLYADEGSSHLRWRDNVVHDAAQGFNINYGADNDVRNNMFVDATQAAVMRNSDNRGGVSPYSATFTHNILVVDDVALYTGFGTAQPQTFRSDHNLLFNVSGEPGQIDLSTPQLLKIVRADDASDVPGSQVQVSLAGDPGTYAYASLPSPVTLAAGTKYHILAQVVSGGPSWYDATPVTTTSAATVLGPVYLAGDEYVYDPRNGCFGPLNFRYTAADDPAAHEYVSGFDDSAALRTNYTGFLGMTIEIGPVPLQVTALGRMRPPGWWDSWRAAGLDSHSVVADPRFVDLKHHDLRLRRSSPALRPPVNFRPIDLHRVGPRRHRR